MPNSAEVVSDHNNAGRYLSTRIAYSLSIKPVVIRRVLVQDDARESAHDAWAANGDARRSLADRP